MKLSNYTTYVELYRRPTPLCAPTPHYIRTTFHHRAPYLSVIGNVNYHFKAQWSLYLPLGLESRNRPGVAQRVPGGLGSQISWHSAHEGGEVVSPTHRPPLPPGMFLVLIFTRVWVDPRAMVRSEGKCHWKIQWHHRKSILGSSDNAPAHREITTQKKLAYLGFHCLDDPPYSQDLAQSDYHLFHGLKKTNESSPFFVRRGGHCCRGDLVGRTNFWFFKSGFSKLEQRAKKCIELRGEDVE